MVSVPLATLFAIAATCSMTQFMMDRRISGLPNYLADRDAEASHVLMNTSMALMFTRMYGEALADLIRALCLVAILLLVGLFALLPGRRSSGRAAGLLFHVIALATMIWSIKVMPNVMSGMGSGVALIEQSSRGWWAALLLAAGFLVDASANALLAVFAPRTMLRMGDLVTGERPTSGSLRYRIRALRLAVAPHVVMDLGMLLMLRPILAGA